MNICIKASKISGSIKAPASKSQTMRAIIFAMLAKTRSKITNYLHSPDTNHLIEILKLFNVGVDVYDDYLLIDPTCFRARSANLYVGNSGIIYRFLSAIVSSFSTNMQIDGDDSIRYQRPIKPLLKALNQAGANIAFQSKECAPFSIKGPWKHYDLIIEGQDSQFVSALIIAACLQTCPVTIHVNNPGEKPWVNMTLSWLDFFKIPYKNTHFESITIYPKAFKGFEYTVPADLSTIAFPIAASILTKGKLSIQNVKLDPFQGDKKLFNILKSMGANLRHEKDTLFVESTSKLRGCYVNINDCIDVLPILSVICCFATTPSKIYGAKIAATKECNRLQVMEQELTKLGAHIKRSDDALEIFPSTLKGGSVSSHSDHRVAMSMLIAGLQSSQATYVSHIDCYKKTYPTFIEDLKKLGANIY